MDKRTDIILPKLKTLLQSSCIRLTQFFEFESPNHNEVILINTSIMIQILNNKTNIPHIPGFHENGYFPHWTRQIPDFGKRKFA